MVPSTPKKYTAIKAQTNKLQSDRLHLAHHLYILVIYFFHCQQGVGDRYVMNSKTSTRLTQKTTSQSPLLTKRSIHALATHFFP